MKDRAFHRIFGRSRRATHLMWKLPAFRCLFSRKGSRGMRIAGAFAPHLLLFHFQLAMSKRGGFSCFLFHLFFFQLLNTQTWSLYYQGHWLGRKATVKAPVWIWRFNSLQQSDMNFKLLGNYVYDLKVTDLEASYIRNSWILLKLRKNNRMISFDCFKL